jgi:hypothetical protein
MGEFVRRGGAVLRQLGQNCHGNRNHGASVLQGLAFPLRHAYQLGRMATTQLGRESGPSVSPVSRLIAKGQMGKLET